MTSNCSLHRQAPLDPALDPAYRDGRPWQPSGRVPTGALDVELPFARLPPAFQRVELVSFERLEELIERQAEREERA